MKGLNSWQCSWGKSQWFWGWALWAGGSRYLKHGAYAGWSTFGCRKKLTWKCVWIFHWRRMGGEGIGLLVREAQQKWWGNQGHGGLFIAEWWFLLVLLSAHRRLPGALTILCNSDLSHHIAHIFSSEQRENCFKLLAILRRGKKSRDTIFSSKLTCLIKIMYQPEYFNTTEIFC